MLCDFTVNSMVHQHNVLAVVKKGSACYEKVRDTFRPKRM